MQRHIRGRVTQRRGEIARPIRVSPWRVPVASARLPDLPSPKRSSGFAQAGTKVFRPVPDGPATRRARLLTDRRARAETELAGMSLKGL